MSGIEMQFIKKWNGWDELDTMTFQFYNCELRPEIFGSTVAEKYAGCDVCLCGDKSVVELYKEDLPVLTYSISLTLSIKD